MNFKIILILVSIIIFTSCDKEKKPAYSRFKTSNYKWMDKIIPVNLDENHQFVIESGFNTASPNYYSQINSTTPQMIKKNLILKEKHGWNGNENLDFERVRISLDFKSTIFNSGDDLRIISRHSGLEESILFTIK